jgi:hypothetical protein
VRLSIPPAPEPRGLRIAAPLLALEGLVALGYGGYLGIMAVRIGPTGPSEVSNTPGLIIEVLLYLAFGVALLAVGHGLWRVSGWSRSPAVLAQLLIAVVAVPLAQAAGPERFVGMALTAAGVAVLVGIFLPASRAAFNERRLPGSATP